MSLPYNKKLIPLAKELRSKMTPQEKRLWYECLSTYPVRFQRQKAIGNYIVDFYCHKAKVIIEVDGYHHYTQDGIKYDNERSAAFNSVGLHVIRLSNSQIDNSFQDACALIHKCVSLRTLPQSLRDSPLGEGAPESPMPPSQREVTAARRSEGEC